MLNWGITAAALLLLVFAVRTLFRSSKAEGDEGRQKLGCGFAVVAAGLWVYVLNQYLDDPWRAIRLGAGVLLVLPSVQAIAKPEGARVMRAAVGLVLAFLIAGPVAADLWAEHGPDTRSDEERDSASEIAELEDLREQLVERKTGLEELRTRVKSEVTSAASSWEEVEANEALLERLEVVHRADEEIARVTAGIEKIDATLPVLRARLASDGAPAAPVASEGDAELDALRRQLEDAPGEGELSTVEQYARKKELQALFEGDL